MMLIAALLAKSTATVGGGGGGSTVPKPTFNPSGGQYVRLTPLTIVISTSVTGGTLRYTKDGTIPTVSHGTLINAQSGTTTVTTNSTTELKAVAISGGVASNVTSATYDLIDP